MEDKSPATQTTPKGHEIPVPKRKEVEDFFKGVTGKAPLDEPTEKRDKPNSR